MLSASSDASTSAAPSSSLARFLAALTVAVGLFFAVVAGSWAGGFGRDLHVLRVSITLGAILAVSLLLVRSSVRLERRVLLLALAIVTGFFCWWGIPSRIGGLNLYSAATKRASIALQLGPARFEDVPAAGPWRNSINELASKYPTLAAPLETQFAAWGADATAAVVERFQDTPASGLIEVRSVRERGLELSRIFPVFSHQIDIAYHQWIQRAVVGHTQALHALTLADWNEFARSAPARRRHIQAFPESRDALIEAENWWVGKSAGAATETALLEIDSNPEQARMVCREVELRVRSLPGLATTAVRFRDTRMALFHAAHDAAMREVHGHLHNRLYDRAFDVALQHSLEWASNIKALSPEEMRALAEFREHSRHLAIRFDKAGVVHPAPPPRGWEFAPPPRSKAVQESPTSERINFIAPRNSSAQDEPCPEGAERKQLEEALMHIRDQKPAFAVARLAPLAKSTTLPQRVVQAIPGLIDDLRSLEGLARIIEAAPGEELAVGPRDGLPTSVRQALAWLDLLRSVSELLETRVPPGTKLAWGVEHAEKLLAAVAADFDSDSASKLRLELSAKLFLLGRPNEATRLLGSEGPSEHAREVLADLRTVILGGGRLSNPQIARFVPEKGLIEIPGALAVVPAVHRKTWQRPLPPEDSESTLMKLAKRATAGAILRAKEERKRISDRVAESAAAMRMELAKP